MGVLCKWEQVTLFCYGHFIMSVTKTVLFLVFSEIENQFFLVCLAPILLSRGPNLSVVNYQNPGKAQEKIKPTLFYDNYVADITLRTSHYRHIILWTLWLHNFNYGNSFGRNKCYMHTNFVQIYHIQVFSVFD